MTETPKQPQLFGRSLLALHGLVDVQPRALLFLTLTFGLGQLFPGQYRSCIGLGALGIILEGIQHLTPQLSRIVVSHPVQPAVNLLGDLLDNRRWSGHPVSHYTIKEIGQRTAPLGGPLGEPAV